MTYSAQGHVAGEWQTRLWDPGPSLAVQHPPCLPLLPSPRLLFLWAVHAYPRASPEAEQAESADQGPSDRSFRPLAHTPTRRERNWLFGQGLCYPVSLGLFQVPRARPRRRWAPWREEKPEVSTEDLPGEVELPLSDGTQGMRNICQRLAVAWTLCLPHLI